MADKHPIFTEKLATLESKTYTDSPIEFTTSATLTKPMLDQINETDGGKVYTWAEMIDNAAEVEKFLQTSVNTSHHLGDSQKMPLNFLLPDVKVHNFQTTDPTGFFGISGILAWPKIQGMTHNTLAHDGKFQKVFCVNRPKVFGHQGDLMAFNHVMKPHNTGAEYILASLNSQMMPSVKYPNGDIHGASPFAVDLVLRDDGTTKVVPRGAGMMHGHMINNGSVYGDVKSRPTWSSFLRPTAGDGVITEEHVLIPPKVYQECWWSKSPQYHTDKGPMVPLPEYVQGTYDFQDQILSSRSTNFNHSGIWWNAQFLRDVPCVKLHLTFRVVPIVDYHSEGAQNIPYQNLVKFAKSEMEEAE